MIPQIGLRDDGDGKQLVEDDAVGDDGAEDSMDGSLEKPAAAEDEKADA